MSIAITYEIPETDEMGIRLTAKEMGIELKHIPFRKIAASVSNEGHSFRSKNRDYTRIIQDAQVVLNRTQSKNRRLHASTMFEAFGKYVLNPSMVEFLCFSKLRTILRLWKAGIRIPRTVYVPCDAHDHISETHKVLHNEDDIADLIQGAISDRSIVIKPDAGTRGRMVRLAKNRAELTKLLDESEPSSINPVGFVAQELIEKWFFDLRIIVARKQRRDPYCYPTALARAGFRDFRTNTYLGNMVFGVKLTSHIAERAVQCAQAIAQNEASWVLALDAMLDIAEDKIVEDEYVKAQLERLEDPFEAVKGIKRQKERTTNFSNWNRLLETAYHDYMSNDAYEKLTKIIEESIERSEDKILFHEANSCPEFWEQTRLVGGVNLAVPLLECAKSIIDGSSCLISHLDTTHA